MAPHGAQGAWGMGGPWGSVGPHGAQGEIEEKRKKVNGEGYTLHRYLRGRLLGKGGFAKVYLCTALDTNKAYAIKIVPKANPENFVKI